MELIVYLVEYKGQTESAYTWCYYTEREAEIELARLQQEYPEREWFIIYKDVS